ncbi:MAG: CBS domain-containing protein [Arthrobacter sp.]
MSDLANLNILRLATHDVVTLDAGASVSDAVAALSDARLKKVPVVNGEDSRPIGIVSRSAINRLAIATYLRSRSEADVRTPA